LDAVYLDNIIDNHFISFLEMKRQPIKFKRVDADISESLKESQHEDKEKSNKKIDKALEKIFKEAIDKDELKIRVEGLKNINLPAMILLSEESRRMEEMMARFGDMGIGYTPPREETLVLNRNSDLIQSLVELSKDRSRDEDTKMICQQIYDLALISHKPLDSEEMMKFIDRSNKILTKLASTNN
jgi:molecular chaperone HtpG